MASSESGNNDLEQEIDTTDENDLKWHPDRDRIVAVFQLKWNWFLRENEKRQKSVQNHALELSCEKPIFI